MGVCPGGWSIGGNIPFMGLALPQVGARRQPLCTAGELPPPRSPPCAPIPHQHLGLCYFLLSTHHIWSPSCFCTHVLVWSSSTHTPGGGEQWKSRLTDSVPRDGTERQRRDPKKQWEARKHRQREQCKEAGATRELADTAGQGGQEGPRRRLAQVP